MQWRVAFLLLGLMFTQVCAKPQTTTAVKHKTKPVSTAKTRGRKSRKVRAKTPSYQLHPDPERYQQIQKALTDKGYFKGQVNGEWRGDSVDALKRFQADQKLTNDGKLSSITLQGLGLGAKHDGSTAPNTATSSSAVTEPLPPASEPPQGADSTPPNQ